MEHFLLGLGLAVVLGFAAYKAGYLSVHKKPRQPLPSDGGGSRPTGTEQR